MIHTINTIKYWKGTLGFMFEQQLFCSFSGNVEVILTIYKLIITFTCFVLIQKMQSVNTNTNDKMIK